MRITIATALKAFVATTAPGSRVSFKRASPFITQDYSRGDTVFLQAPFDTAESVKFHPEELRVQVQSGSAMLKDARGASFTSSLWASSNLLEDEKPRKQPQLTWEDKFALLRLFKRAFGHCDVPPNFVVHGFKLGGWLDTQRKEFKKHRLGLFSPVINEKRIGRLERVGMEWEPQVHVSGEKQGLFALKASL